MNGRDFRDWLVFITSCLAIGAAVTTLVTVVLKSRWDIDQARISNETVRMLHEMKTGRRYGE